MARLKLKLQLYCGDEIAIGPGKADLNAEDQARRQRYADGAVAALRQAAERGIQDREMIEKDPDFDSIRQRDDYRRLIRDLGVNASAIQGAAPVNKLGDDSTR